MIKLYSSIFMIVLTFIIVFFISKKYDLDRNQKLIFWLFVLFWSGITVVRAYRKLYAISPIEEGGLGFSIVLAAQITSAYGLISCFIRLPIFILSDIFNRKKIFIQIALFALTLASVMVVLKPSYNTLYFSSIAMGICASMLAVFNVLFSETFSKEKAAISASILSVAPLLAEFIAAPIQYLSTYGTYKNFKLLWALSATLSIVAFVLTFFVKDVSYSAKRFSFEKVKKVFEFKGYLYICLIAILVSFIKFSTSGANMIAYAKVTLNMPPILLAYIDVLFAFPQLIASVLAGTYFAKKIGIEKTLVLGLVSSLVFYIIIILTDSYLPAFLGYMFNGFGYGIAYTCLISMAMQYFEKEDRNVSMGIFQLFFAMGVYFGDRVYLWISKLIPNGILGFEQNKSIYLIVVGITLISILMAQLKIKDNVGKTI